MQLTHNLILSLCKARRWQEIIVAHPSITSFLLIYFFSEKVNIRKLTEFMQNVIQCYTNNCNMVLLKN